MGWFGALFSSGEIVKRGAVLVDDAIRGIGRWIDEQQLTDEEKLRAREKQLELYGKFLERALEESGPRTITRRLIALAVMSVYLLLVVAGSLTYWLDPDWARWLLEWLDETQFWLISFSIVSFYFGTHLIRAAFPGGRKRP